MIAQRAWAPWTIPADNLRMQIDDALPLLGGLSPQAFMRRHWQKKPLLIRQALPGVRPPVTRAELFALAAREEVESRLVVQGPQGWSLKHGPFARRALPALAQPGWTLLVQGLDLHVQAAHHLLSRFRFVPQARLDDLMMSYASDGGGVGPHLDSYDVFLLQVAGLRRWRVGRVRRPTFRPDMPLRLLEHFEPEQEWLLEPGDMLYVPPRWGHDGVAQGECMTCSIGFRSPWRGALGVELIQRIADAADAAGDEAMYRDAGEAATAAPGRIPPSLQAFAARAVARAMGRPGALAQALGEWLTEPKPQVSFELGDALPAAADVALDRRSRMMYDASHVFINGEAYRCAGRDARLVRELADRGTLSVAKVARLSDGARALVAQWVDDGWLHAKGEIEDRDTSESDHGRRRSR